MRLITTTCALLLLMAAPAAANGLRLRHVSGGPTSALEVHGGWWYQSLGDRLAVINAASGTLQHVVQLSAMPASDTCRDLLAIGDELWVLMESGELAMLAINGDAAPRVQRRWSPNALGILPGALADIQGAAIAMGEGGAVRLSNGERVVTADGTVTTMAFSDVRGLIYGIDWRLHEADSGKFVGSATLLGRPPVTANVDGGTIVMARAIEHDTEVGLLDATLREINAAQTTRILQGRLRSMRIVGSRVLVCTDRGVTVLGMAPRELRVLRQIDFPGASDADVISSNYLALSGDSGRAIYRINADSGGSGDRILRYVPAPARFNPGAHDRAQVTIPTLGGAWRYTWDQPVIPVTDSVAVASAPMRAVVLGWEAAIDETATVHAQDADGRSVTFDDLESPAYTIAAVGGDFWIGTESGIVVYSGGDAGVLARVADASIAGPVIQIIPLLDGGAAFVSAAGYVGVAERR